MIIKCAAFQNLLIENQSQVFKKTLTLLKLVCKIFMIRYGNMKVFRSSFWYNRHG